MNPLSQKPESMHQLHLLFQNYACFTAADFGFKGPLETYAKAYKSDKIVREMVDRFQGDVLALMEIDTAELPTYDPVTGAQFFNEKGEAVTALKSKWDSVGTIAIVKSGNPRTKPSFWYDYVKENFLALLPLFTFYDPTPARDPQNPKTRESVDYAMNEDNPRRAKALEFLKSRKRIKSQAPVAAGRAE